MKPKVIIYNAISVDGRTQGFAIDMGLFYSLAQQWGEHVSLVGCDTLLNAPDDIPKDDEHSPVPMVTPSADDGRPILVVSDSRGRLKTWHYWRRQPYWKDFISLCTQRTPSEHLAYLTHNGIKSIEAGAYHVDFRQVLDKLNTFGGTIVRVDSGGTLNGILLRARLVDELHLLLHPTLVGGTSQKTFFNDLASENGDVIPLRFIESQVEDKGILRLSYAVLNCQPF